MAGEFCLAGIEEEKIALLGAAAHNAGFPNAPRIASGLDVAEIGKLAPEVLMCDLDGLAVDPLEKLRQLRFVLPGCTIVIYTGRMKEHWAASCHRAGANGVLAKASSEAQLSIGVRRAIRSGCYTDARFAAPRLRGEAT